VTETQERETPSSGDLVARLLDLKQFMPSLRHRMATIDAAATLLQSQQARIEELERERAEARKPKRDEMIDRTDEEWEALEDAIMTFISLQSKVGHILTENDVAALQLVDSCQRNDEEAATDAYNRGYKDGLRDRGGDELVRLVEAADASRIEAATERTMCRLANRRSDEFEASLSEARERLERAEAALRPFALKTVDFQGQARVCGPVPQREHYAAVRSYFQQADKPQGDGEG
jgi:hypothetical protein